MARGKLIIALLVMVAALTQGQAGAHTGWKVQGSLAWSVNLSACAYSVRCVTAYGTTMFAMHHDSSLPICQDDFPMNDTDMSIRKLPTGVGGHKAQITYTATAGPVDTIVTPPWVVVHFFRPGPAPNGFDLRGPCGYEMLGAREIVTISGAKFTVEPTATHVGISAKGAADMDWTISGVTH